MVKTMKQDFVNSIKKQPICHRIDGMYDHEAKDIVNSLIEILTERLNEASLTQEQIDLILGGNKDA